MSKHRDQIKRDHEIHQVEKVLEKMNIRLDHQGINRYIIRYKGYSTLADLSAVPTKMIYNFLKYRSLSLINDQKKGKFNEWEEKLEI